MSKKSPSAQTQPQDEESNSQVENQMASNANPLNVDIQCNEDTDWNNDLLPKSHNIESLMMQIEVLKEQRKKEKAEKRKMKQDIAEAAARLKKLKEQEKYCEDQSAELLME